MYLNSFGLRATVQLALLLVAFFTGRPSYEICSPCVHAAQPEAGSRIPQSKERLPVILRRIIYISVASALLFTFALAATTASANRLSVSNKNFRGAWRALRVAPGEIECPITLEGSFHSNTISKVIGALAGYVSRATVANANCTGGHSTALQESLPWHVNYGGFEGSLPNITGLRIGLIGVALQLELSLFGAICLAKSTAERPVSGIARLTAGRITSLRADETRTIPLTGECAIFGETRFSGEGTFTVLGSTAGLTVRLI